MSLDHRQNTPRQGHSRQPNGGRTPRPLTPIKQRQKASAGQRVGVPRGLGRYELLDCEELAQHAADQSPAGVTSPPSHAYMYSPRVIRRREEYLRLRRSTTGSFPWCWERASKGV